LRYVSSSAFKVKSTGIEEIQGQGGGNCGGYSMGEEEDIGGELLQSICCFASHHPWKNSWIEEKVNASYCAFSSEMK
jgi:hypothetical protein